MPSVQLSNYLQLRANGESVEVASTRSGIGLAEARLHEEDIASGDLPLPAPSLERGEGGRGQAVPALTQQAAATPGKCESMAPANVAKQHSNPPRPDALEGRAPEPLPPPSRARAPARARKTEQSKGTTMANGTVAADELRLLIERIERVKEEIKGLNDDVRDIYAEAKSRGFDTPAMKSVVKLRKMEPHTRQEAEAILLAYMDALGLVQSEASIALAA